MNQKEHYTRIMPKIPLQADVSDEIEQIIENPTTYDLTWESYHERFTWNEEISELKITKFSQSAVRVAMEETIEFDWTPNEISTIVDVAKYGTGSGTWMPCVTYFEAESVMHEFGDEILQYIFESGMDDVPPRDACMSWGTLCVYYYSLAVEIYCSAFCQDWEG